MEIPYMIYKCIAKECGHNTPLNLTDIPMSLAPHNRAAGKHAPAQIALLLNASLRNSLRTISVGRTTLISGHNRNVVHVLWKAKPINLCCCVNFMV